MTMKKQDRKKAYTNIIGLLIKGENKEAYGKLTAMCGEDTGLFILTGYDKAREMNKGKGNEV